MNPTINLDHLEPEEIQIVRDLIESIEKDKSILHFIKQVVYKEIETLDTRTTEEKKKSD